LSAVLRILAYLKGSSWYLFWPKWRRTPATANLTTL
jgi:hypothetical protein